MLLTKPMIQFRDCMTTERQNGTTESDVKEVMTKQLKYSPMRKGEEENQSSED